MRLRFFHFAVLCCCQIASAGKRTPEVCLHALVCAAYGARLSSWQVQRNTHCSFTVHLQNTRTRTDRVRRCVANIIHRTPCARHARIFVRPCVSSVGHALRLPPLSLCDSKAVQVLVVSEGMTLSDALAEVRPIQRTPCHISLLARSGPNPSRCALIGEPLFCHLSGRRPHPVTL